MSERYSGYDYDDIPRPKRERTDVEVDALIDERKQREIDGAIAVAIVTNQMREIEGRMCESLDKISDAVIAINLAGQWE